MKDARDFLWSDRVNNPNLSITKVHRLNVFSNYQAILKHLSTTQQERTQLSTRALFSERTESRVSVNVQT